MKLLCIHLLTAGADPIILSEATDLSSFSFLTRTSVNQFLTFLSTTVAPRTASGQRQSITKDSYTAHVFSHSSGIVGVITADNEYPARVAFSLLNKILEEFTVQVPRDQIDRARGGGGKVVWTPLEGYLQKYQDPKQADTILKVQQELDETKVILHKTIEQVLERGERLDDLVERSNTLSTTSKQFYKTAKKQNSCCIIS